MTPMAEWLQNFIYALGHGSAVALGLAVAVLLLGTAVVVLMTRK